MEYFFRNPVYLICFLSSISLFGQDQELRSSQNSISIDNSIGIQYNDPYDIYVSPAFLQYQDGINLPSFTITVNLKEKLDLKVQFQIDKRSSFGIHEASFLMLAKEVKSSKKSKLYLEGGLFFDLGSEKFISTTQKAAEFRYRPGVVISSSYEYDLNPRLFLRTQILVLSKIGIYPNAARLHFAGILNFGLGMRFGRV